MGWIRCPSRTGRNTRPGNPIEWGWRVKGIICFGLLTAALPLFAADREIDYQRDVKPILHSRCYACHGALKQEAGLRLDSGVAIREGGESGPAIVVGKAAASLIVERVSSADADHRMPPQGKPLTAEQVQAIKHWITQGAQSPSAERPETDPRSHWAFRSPQRPEVPELNDAETKAWIRNPIDAFIVARHRRHGLTPQSPANKAALLRRVYLDLIGLPPTRQQLIAFLGDDSADAYKNVVERLLNSPQYGERWGRHWMDVWRYSDWYGRRAANDVRNSSRQIWRWRDWIIRSLNEDKPYGQMIIEMLAGDEIAPNDPDVVVATGFIVRNCYRLNFHTWKQDMVEHTGKAFLGLTFNCALCHDHKYDPITHEDYFRFRAFFEPLRLRHDRMPGEPDPGPYVEYDFDSDGHRPVQGGLARVYDETLALTTPMYRLGDARDLIEDKPPVSAGIPTFFGSEPLEIEPVDLPSPAWYPGVKPFIQEEEIATRVAAVNDAEADLKKSRHRAAELPGKLKQQEAALRKAKQMRVRSAADAPSTATRAAAVASLAEMLSEQTIGYWRFEGDDRVGDFLTDSSGRGHTLRRVSDGGTPVSRAPVGANTRGPASTKTPFDAGSWFVASLPTGSANQYAARFQQNSRSAYLAVSGTPELHAPQFTLQVLFHHSSARQGVNCTIADYEGSWWFYHRGLNSQESELRLVLWNPDTDYLDVVTGTELVLETNTDYYIAVVLDENDVSFYVRNLSTRGPLQTATFDRRQGVSRGGGSADLTDLRKPDPKTPLRIGNSLGGGAPHRGLLDEIRYCRVALTANQIGALAALSPEQRQLAAIRQAETRIRQLLEQRSEAETAVRVGTAKLAHARAELAGIRARVAADNARHKTDKENGERLAKVAAIAERQGALARAQWELVQAEQVLQAARQKGDTVKAEQQVGAVRRKRDAVKKSLQSASKSPVTEYTPLSEQFPQQSSGGRTALARWIANRKNPLTARVAVNHIWMRHFGRPLVESVYDFGLSSKPPTHPQLLDWLAVDFMENHWKMKRLHKLIVTSQTYQMASGDRHPTQANATAYGPGGNRYLWRFPRRRMEAEAIRDSLLHLAGSIDLKRGGPDIDTSLGSTVNRRSLYFTVHPEDGMMRFMTVFNPPDPCDCYRRTESVAPHQALAMTNSRIAVDQSRLLARKLWSEIKVEQPVESDRIPAFIEASFQHVLTRLPTDQEEQACHKFVVDQIKLFQEADPLHLKANIPKSGVAPSTDPVLRALDSLIGAILSHHDFVTIQ